MKARKKIKVLIVDDSAVVRRIASDILSNEPDIEVVGTAIDPYAARDKILKLEPDVVTLDIEMPRMDGLTFLKIIMEKRPMPVIIMSSLSQEGSEYAMKALQLGAVDVLGKPDGSFSVGSLEDILIEKIRGAAQARIRPKTSFKTQEITNNIAKIQQEQSQAIIQHKADDSSKKIILIGASTGGTEALKDVLSRLPNTLPPIAIVQHIPPYFSKAFANRMNETCKMEVREAKNGDSLRPGVALIAPGDYHMILQGSAGSYSVQLKQGPPVWHQRPAVDILFKSAAPITGNNATGVILTGMGRDGAEGLLELRQAGAQTFAQDEESCVVYGMPRAAYEVGAAMEMVPLKSFPEKIVRSLQRQKALA